VLKLTDIVFLLFGKNISGASSGLAKFNKIDKNQGMLFIFSTGITILFG